MTINCIISTESPTRGLTAHRITEDIHRAARTWCDAVNQSPAIRVHKEITIKFRFGRLKPDQAATSFPGDHPEIVFSNGAEMKFHHFTDSWMRRWLTGSLSLYAIALHEIGHILGLRHNFDDLDSIMDPQAPYSGFRKGLPEPDKKAIVDLLLSNAR